MSVIDLPVKKNIETAIEKFIDKNMKKYSLPKTALKALKDFGIFDARVLSVLTETEIAAIPGISEKTASALVRAADDNFRGPLFQKAADQSERLLEKRKYFTTGSANLDAILGGGMPTSAIVEINGEYRTGKTQTCLTCSVTAQLPESEGGLGRPVIYFDTENSFQAEHLQKIGERFGFEKDEILENLFIVEAEQLRYLNQAIDRLPGYVQALDPGLIVIDSLMAPFRTEFHELNLLAVRQKKLGRLIGLLKRIAIAFNTCVIFTNQVMANIGTYGAQFNPVIATGGHVVAHASDIRITMRKKKDDKREAKIQDCAWLPSNAAEFYITSKGISDVEEKKKDDKKKVETEEVAGVSPVKEGLEAVAQSKKAKKAEKLSSPPPEEGEDPQVPSSQPVKTATAASEKAKVEHEEKAPIKKSATKKKAPKASAKKSKVPA